MRLVCFLVAIFLAGCVSAPVRDPIIDFGSSSSADEQTYNRDITDCRALAQRADVGTSAVNGAVAGALFGALLGVAIGGRDMLGAGARAGAAGGLGGGVVAGVTAQQIILSRCMAARGYSVVSP